MVKCNENAVLIVMLPLLLSCNVLLLVGEAALSGNIRGDTPPVRVMRRPSRFHEFPSKIDSGSLKDTNRKKIHKFSSVSSVPITDTPAAFWETYDDVHRKCIIGNDTENNGEKLWHSKDSFVRKPVYEWSVDSGLLHAMLGVTRGNQSNGTSTTRKSTLRLCSSMEEVAQLFGTLMGEDSVNGGHLKDQRCRLMWFNPLSYCSVFSKFTEVSFQGDSLTRHLIQALHMVGSQNWFNGAYPCQNVWAEMKQQYCHCDKQVLIT